MLTVFRLTACRRGTISPRLCAVRPDQETVLPFMDILSDSAKRIGAVNTVTKQPDGKLHGDNTDWLGIKNQFESRLRARGGWAPATTTARRGTVAMLCGAGGTAKAAAYCFEQMGCSHVIIMNRTLSRAQALADVSVAICTSDDRRVRRCFCRWRSMRIVTACMGGCAAR